MCVGRHQEKVEAGVVEDQLDEEEPGLDVHPPVSACASRLSPITRFRGVAYERL